MATLFAFMEIGNSLIQACIKGKTKAQLELYKKCYALLFGLCMRYKTNKVDAEAVFNIIFLKILDNLKQLDQDGNFIPWARKVMINALIDDYRKEKRRREKERQLADDNYRLINGNTSSNQGFLELEAQQIRDMIMALPETTRLVFNMFAIDGYSHMEIAELLAISTGTSKWHVSNARKILRDKLKNEKTQVKLVKNG